MLWVADGEDIAPSTPTVGAAGNGGSESQRVLVVANSYDPEADFLAATIEARGGTFVRLNIEDPPSSLRVTCYPNASVSEGTLVQGNVTISLADFSAAWAACSAA